MLICCLMVCWFLVWCLIACCLLMCSLIVYWLLGYWFAAWWFAGCWFSGWWFTARVSRRLLWPLYRYRLQCQGLLYLRRDYTVTARKWVRGSKNTELCVSRNPQIFSKNLITGMRKLSTNIENYSTNNQICCAKCITVKNTFRRIK